MTEAEEAEEAEEEIVFHEIAQELISAISFNAGSISVAQEEKFEKIYELIKKAPIIITTGAGRSGFIAQFIVQRLFHALQIVGKAYYIDDTTRPRISKDCAVIMFTGSGETKGQLSIAKAAKEIGAKLIVVTTFPEESTIGKLADIVIEVPGRNTEEPENIMPLGTKFELTALVLFEVLNAYIIKKDKITPEKLREMHRNLE
ncbi:SIS domain-containing protein [Candidatus Parcubacteria bacterium]|nr:SIS domain-containing protein [Candidatus Parcubacteria bacterium]